MVCDTGQELEHRKPQSAPPTQGHTHNNKTTPPNSVTPYDLMWPITFKQTTTFALGFVNLFIVVSNFSCANSIQNRICKHLLFKMD